MENHPIPQDVTGFKFKIIGSITIKQFGYLLAAGILASITLFLLPISPLIKLPLTLLFALIGVGLAFVPIDGRPMDVMIVNFAKAVQAENQYIYRKLGTHILALDLLAMPTKAAVTNLNPSNNQTNNKRLMLEQMFQNSYTKVDDENAQAVNQILSEFSNPASPKTALSASQPVTPPKASAQTNTTTTDSVKARPVSIPLTTQVEPPPQASSPINQTTTKDLTTPVAPMEIIQKEEAKIRKSAEAEVQEAEEVKTGDMMKLTLDELQKEIKDVETQEASQGKTQDLESKIKELEVQLNEVLAQKETLEKKMYTMENKRADSPVFAPANSAKTSEPTTPNAQVINSSAQQFKAGFPTLPEIPNVVMGIVKDPRGKVLPNILVEVVDGNEIPVRAFKTNALGQFASATPLQNGAYKVYFEDPQKRNEFDTIEITLDGNSIFDPLEVTSVDQREKLRRELFTGQAVAQ